MLSNLGAEGMAAEDGPRLSGRSAPLTIAFFATFSSTMKGAETGIAGITERVIVSEILAWYVAMGWHASRQRLPTRDTYDAPPTARVPTAPQFDTWQCIESQQ